MQTLDRVDRDVQVPVRFQLPGHGVETLGVHECEAYATVRPSRGRRNTTGEAANPGDMTAIRDVDGTTRSAPDSAVCSLQRVDDACPRTQDASTRHTGVTYRRL